MTEDPEATPKGANRATPAELYSTVCKAFDQAASMLAPPEDAVKHFREARIQFLKGLRGLIDHRIDNLSRSDSKGRRVVVE